MGKNNEKTKLNNYNMGDYISQHKNKIAFSTFPIANIEFPLFISPADSIKFVTA